MLRPPGSADGRRRRRNLHQVGRDLHVTVLSRVATVLDALSGTRSLGRVRVWRTAAERARQRSRELVTCRACGADPYDLDHLAQHGPPEFRRGNPFRP